MTYYFTADTHFSHVNILKHCNRPFKNVEEMDRILIERWNDKVSDNDTVFFLGDFAWKNEKKYKSQLNGKIIHISGNHDNNVVIQDMIIYIGGKYWHLAHKPEDCHGEFNLCGHVHERWKVKRENGNIYVNCGVDVWDYTPITIGTILKAIK